MTDIERNAIEALEKIKEGVTEFSDILLVPDNGVVREAFYEADEISYYSQIFCGRFFTEWANKLIKAINDKTTVHSERWRITMLGNGTAFSKYFEDGHYEEALCYGNSMKEEAYLVLVYEFDNTTGKYILGFSL